MIFGSEKFEPMVGELKIASYLQRAQDLQSGNESGGDIPDLSKFRQRKREVQCALNLSVKLQPFVDSGGNSDSFRESVSLLRHMFISSSCPLHFID